MRRVAFCAIAGALILTGCGAANSAPSVPGELLLGAPHAYLGFAACQPNIVHCLRGPGVGINIAVSQTGNASDFSASSSDPTVATGSLVMLGPGGHGSPAIQLASYKAGVADIVVSGANGATATLPVTVTTVSTMTVTLNGLPTATDLAITVASPPSPQCPPFVGGYSFDAQAPTPPATSVTLGNFPAMGNGPSSLCIFSTVTIAVKDNANNTLAQKTIHPAITLGSDNPQAVVIP
jgi:hypothetical protein